MRRFSFASLRARVLLLILLATLPALGLTLYSGLQERRNAIERAKIEAMRLARCACRTEKVLIDSAHQVLAGLAELHALRHNDLHQCSLLLGKLLKLHSQYANFGVADLDGKVICSGVPFPPGTTSVSIADRPYFQRTLQTKDFGIGNHQLDRILHRPTVNFAYPVLNDSGSITAVVFAALDMSLFSDIASEIRLPDGATLTVRDHEGTILTRYPEPEAWITRKVPDASILQAILDHKGEGTAEARGVDNVSRMYAFTILDSSSELGLYLSVGIPTDMAMAESTRDLLLNVAGLGLAAFLAFVAAWYGGEAFVVRRVSTLVDTTKRLASGELSARITPAQCAYGDGELDQLARALDEMAASLERSTVKLRETEAQYRILVEQVPAITYVAALDEARSLIYISPQVQVMLGIPTRHWIADPTLWSARLHPDDRERVLAELAQVVSGQICDHFCSEYRMLAAGGRELWIRDEARLVRGRPERPDALHGIMRDISERKQAEDALRYSEGKYRTIFETTGTATIIIEESTKISLANEEFLRLIGCTKEEIEGRRSWMDFFLPEDALMMKEYHRLRRLDPQKAPRNYICRLVSSSGQIHHMFASVSMIPGSRRSVASFLDITEHKRSEEALRESEERYRQFFEEDLTGDFIADAQGCLIANNPAFSAMFGFDTSVETTKLRLNTLFVSQEAWERFLDAVRHRGKLSYWEMELRSCSGSPVHVVANILGSFDEQREIAEIKGYLFNDTSRKNLEQQLLQSQKMEAIGRLAGGVAHDFNNLLTIISGYSDIILDSVTPEEPLHKYAAEIQRAGERAAGLTHQLLAFSRKQILQPKIINLNDVVANMDKMLRRLIGEDIELTTSLDSGLGPVKADPGQIEQVIMNLAVNARDAMPKGGKLTIETAFVELREAHTPPHHELEPGRYAMLSVGDNGIGMSFETQSRIFEPFFTTKEQGKGTGLGLPMVYGIVKQSGGHIRVYSEPGMGTTFRIYLPYVEHESVPESKGKDRSLKHLPRGTETVLLVEDDDMVRQAIRRILAAGGYTVIEAADGNEALHIEKEFKEPIHLLLTDVVMPVMNGYDLAMQLTPLRPALKVLFLSGYTDNTILQRGNLEPGMGFLPKPFTPEALRRKIREVLDVSP